MLFLLPQVLSDITPSLYTQFHMSFKRKKSENKTTNKAHKNLESVGFYTNSMSSEKA